MTHYTVWLQVERIDEENDEYTNMAEPEPLASFSTEADADAFVRRFMQSIDADGWETSSLNERRI